jgi:HK97 family phage prohead protease
MNTEQLARLPMEYRSAGPVVEVRYPDRIIEMVAVPYDEDALVPYRGGWIHESVAPGSFDGVERRSNSVKLNRDHDINRTCGRCRALHPSRTEGLVADIYVSRTPLGDETLEMAADGILDASVGFLPFPGHEHFTENRTRRRITKAFLGHIAMTAEPAYEGARVLAVRNVVPTTDDKSVVRVPTPNLDKILAQRLEEAYRHR